MTGVTDSSVGESPANHDPKRSPLELMLDTYRADLAQGQVQAVGHYLQMISEGGVTLPRGGLGSSPPTLGEPREPEGLIRRFGPYEIERRLGQGGQGMVFLARDTRLGRRVALKMLPALSLGSEVLLERFRREAEIASRLDHEAICPVYESSTEAGCPYIAMRYIEGASLADHLDEARARREDEKGLRALNDAAHSEDSLFSGTSSKRLGVVLEIIETCARALHAAHEAGIIHRDVKPGNIMLTSEGRPIILDFGLARDEAMEGGVELTATQELFGTPAYMSPEQVSRKTRLDRRTDIWSLGVVLYEALALERPFRAASRHELFEMILHLEPPISRREFPSRSRDLVSVLRTALEKDCDRRYQTALEFADDLFRMREHRPVMARPVGPMVRALRFAQRNSALSTAVLLVILSLAGGLIATLSQRSKALRALEDYEGLADGVRARELLKEQEELWPAHPRMLKRLDLWLKDALSLVASGKRHRDRLASLLGGNGKGDDAPLRMHLLKGMVDDLDRLSLQTAPIAQRRERARTLADSSVGPDQRRLWDDAIAVARGDRYGGLTLEPIIGLLPLGADRESGLLEFAHLLSGEPPVRNDRGDLKITATSSIVLVLLPAAEFAFGAPREECRKPGGKSLIPVRRESIEAWFVSKFEMTQAQWQASTGEQVAHYQRTADGKAASLHPVENVDRATSERVLAKMDLELPSEVLWEWAARGGTEGTYWTGIDLAAAERASNVADASRRRAFPSDAGSLHDDGHVFHAAIGSFPANPFGFHDVLGNVSEWCSDDVVDHETKRTRQVYRGGNFRSPIIFGASYSRALVQEMRSIDLGVRPARRLRP